jgi:hypothetical protein
MFLEYHPHVRFYQRGDASPACASAYGLVTDLGTPYRINYVFEGKPHEYLPDFVGTLCDGGLLIAEAGREREKSKGKALVKAEAARRLAQIKGGEYWIGTDVNLSERRHQNWLYLHARRQSFPTYAEISTALLAQWPYGDMRCVSELVRSFGPHWSEGEGETAVWKLVGDAAAEGRLLVDLTEVELSHARPLALLEPGIPPILPDPLPNALEETGLVDIASSEGSDEDLVLDPLGGIPGPTFDASVLATAEEQAGFHRNLAAVTAVLAGMSGRSVAQAHGMAISALSRLVRRTKELGQMACVPYGTSHRDRTLHPEFQQLMRKLYTQPLRPTIMAVYEDVQLKHLAGRQIHPSTELSPDLGFCEGDCSRDKRRRRSPWPQASSTGAHVPKVVCPLHCFACLDLKGATNTPWISSSSLLMGPSSPDEFTELCSFV